MPDLENAGCILFWGYNPNLARLAHATATMTAIRRGARLIVIDPRRTGPAKKADLWLQVRPGTDGALALAIANVMIAKGWYDDTFIRDWTNGPFLVCSSNGKLLTEHNLDAAGSPRKCVSWNEVKGGPVIYDPAAGSYDEDNPKLALFGEFNLDTVQGKVLCRPVFDVVAELCRHHGPKEVETVCGVPPHQVEATARLLWEARPVAYYVWSGLEMQSNATQTARVIAQLYVPVIWICKGATFCFQACLPET